MSNRRLSLAVGLVALAAGALAVGGAGCSSCAKTAGSQTAREDVALVPKDTSVLAMLNVSRMRDTAVWRKLLDLRDQAAADKKKADEEAKREKQQAIDEAHKNKAANGTEEPKDEAPADESKAPKDFEDFVAKCGLDPFKDIDSAMLALPGATSEGEFGVIVRGTFDEGKLVACGKEMAKKEGGELVETEYDGKKMYNDSSSGTMFVTFVDAKTIFLGGRDWSKKMLDLQTGKGETKESAKDNAPLVELMKKARTSDALWGVGLVSDSVREQLKNNERLQSAGSLKDLYGSMDFASGLALAATAELGSDADAATLAKTIGEQLVEAKKNPQIMMMGLSSYIDAMKVEAQGPAFKLSCKLNQQQVDELVGRIEGMFKSATTPRRGMMPGLGFGN